LRYVLANPHFRAGFAQMMAVNIGLTPFGLVCGVGAAAAGTNLLGALGMSAIIFSGAAQILAIQLLAAGAPLAVIVLTCFVAGLRFLMYSAAMAPYLRPLSPRWQRVLAFLLTDQAFAASIRRFDSGDHPREGAMHFLGGGIALWSWWQVTNVVGFLAGNLIPASWSLDFTVPLCFVGLLVPVLRTPSALIAALVAGVAVHALEALPMHLNLLAAGLAGIAAGTLADTMEVRWKRS
jgi:predicted branched-subunit amino acid permease